MSYELVTQNSAEVLNEEQVRNALTKKKPVVYCGYELNGEVHLGHLVTITKLKDFQKAGFLVKVLFADWHTWLNLKGNPEDIKKTMSVWRKAFEATGLKAEYVTGSSFQQSPEYLNDLFIIAQNTTINRGLRSMQQVARDIEHAKISQVIYPLMQIVDQKYLGVDVTTSGIEQRKIHALGLEVYDQIGFVKPGYVHTPLIPSLKGSGKMSSSIPESLISIRDTAQDITKKISKAHCPASETKDNPVLTIAQLLLYPNQGKLTIKRDEKYGGNVTYETYEALEEAFKKGLHPADLKKAVGEALNTLLKPMREAFNT